MLAELEEDHRRVIELLHFEQLPFAEIGRLLERSENAAQLLHTRSPLRLHQALDRYGSSWCWCADGAVRFSHRHGLQ